MFTRKSFRLSRGFTLVELLVVMAIIAILSTLLILQFNVARSKARDTKRIADIGSLQGAIEQYYNDKGGLYPPSPLAYADLSPYLNVSTLPTDPLSNAVYYYAVNGVTRTKYSIYTELERDNVVTKSDYDINSTGWIPAGFNNSTIVTTEACVSTSYISGTSKQCVYDVGQR